MAGKEKTPDYSTREISFAGETKSIIMQNEKGSDRLVSICNAMILRSEMFLGAEETQLHEWELYYKLEEICPEEGKATLYNGIFGTSSEIQPNPTWERIDSFEDKDCSELFQVFHLPLYHGWVVADYQNAEGKTVDDIAAKQDDRSELENVMLMNHFEISDCGHKSLLENIEEHQVCVLFCNRCFFTVTKHEEQLYLLLTDENTSDAVWEKVDGSLVGNEFKNILMIGEYSVSGEEDTVEQKALQEGVVSDASPTSLTMHSVDNVEFTSFFDSGKSQI